MMQTDIKQFMIDEIAIRGDGVCAMYTSVHYIKTIFA